MNERTDGLKRTDERKDGLIDTWFEGGMAEPGKMVKWVDTNLNAWVLGEYVTGCMGKWRGEWRSG